MKTLLFLLGCIIARSSSLVNKVVDLSHWNNVDFKIAKQDGVLGVIHKATQGILYTDPTYHQRRIQAEEEGLLWGAYHFGIGTRSGLQQADHFLKTVGNIDNVLLVLDLEPYDEYTMGIEVAEEFVQRIVEKTQRHPVIYGSSNFLSSYIGKSDVLKQCKLWIAHYTGEDSPRLPTGKDSWLFWQYTNGKVGGTPKLVEGIGPCDRDRFNGEEEELLKKWPHF